MTPEEQNFYYFKLHDTNNDNRLDGLEVVAAFDHVHEEENNNNTATGQPPAPHERIADEELIRLVDDILKEEDGDRDGYISYEEFKRAIEGSSHQ
jgi:Ca2+-binding EF-hand superfamily protein